MPVPKGLDVFDIPGETIRTLSFVGFSRFRETDFFYRLKNRHEEYGCPLTSEGMGSTEAEAVADLIASQTAAAMDTAIHAMR